MFTKLKKFISGAEKKEILAQQNHSIQYQKQLANAQEKIIQQQKSMSNMLDYFFYEISELRTKTRHLLANDEKSLPLLNQTYDSFNWQWDKLNTGEHLLSDEAFKSSVIQQILDYTALPESWFFEKKVLDAGCGQGRFSYGFGLLKTHLTAVDQSDNAIKNTQEVLEDISPTAIVKKLDLLEPITLNDTFDLVWSYGVLHHTGNTYQAFQNLCKLVKPNGYLFLMLYGEPQLDNIPSFRERSEYSRLRQKARNLPYERKIELILKEKPKESLHGWFDAISPTINDTYSLEEIRTWLLSAGFKNIKVTSTSTNHHVVAQKNRAS